MSNRKARRSPASATPPARKVATTATPKPAHGGRRVRLPSAKATAAAASATPPAAPRKPATPQIPAPGPHTIGGIKAQEPAAAASPQTATQPATTEAAPLPEPQTVRVSLNRLAAALTTAASKDQRVYLNGVYLHQVGGELRIVATDGHRMLVQTQEQTEVLGWGEAGIIIPGDQLGQVMKFAGKDAEDSAVISYGIGHAHAVITADFGQFQIRPIDAKYAPYDQVLAGIGGTLEGGEREVLTTSGLNAKYVKAAGAVAAALGSEGLFFFPGKDDRHATLFTFPGCAGALLIIMPCRMDAPALSGQVVRMIGSTGMASSIAALKAHATRNREAAKVAKTDEARERFTALVEGFEARIGAIMAGLKPALPAPAAEKEAAAA